MLVSTSRIPKLTPLHLIKCNKTLIETVNGPAKHKI